MSQISFTVPTMAKGSNPIGWVACAAMILSWRRKSSVSIESLIGADSSDSSIANPANGDWRSLRGYLEAWGFFCQTLHSRPMVDFLQIRLAEHGPLLYIHSVAGSPYDERFPASTLNPPSPWGAVHAVVITGVDAGEHTFSFANPWGLYGEAPIGLLLDWLDVGVMRGGFPLAYIREPVSC
jgi:hypothetical protein